MQLEHSDNNGGVFKRFERMLDSNDVQYFDAGEFQQVIEHYLDHGKMLAARRALRLGLAQHPSNMDLRILKVDLLLMDNNLDEAAALSEELCKMYPTNTEIQFQRASIVGSQGNHARSVELLLELLPLTVDKSGVYNLIGLQHMMLDEYEKACGYFKKCLLLDKDDYSALDSLIYCYEYLEKPEEIIMYLNQYLDKNPYSELAWHQLGRQYVAISDYDKALAAFDFAIIADDNFLGAYMEKAKVLEGLGRYHESLDNYMITMELDDPTSFAMLRVGHCLEKLGRGDESTLWFERCVQDDPLFEEAWVALAAHFTQRGEFTLARKTIMSALDIDSENGSYWLQHAQVHKKLSRLEEAEVGYRRCMELGNSDLHIIIERSDLLELMGNYAMALDVLNQGLLYHVDASELQVRLASLSHLMGERSSAVESIKVALAQDPESAIVLQLINESAYDDLAQDGLFD